MHIGVSAGACVSDFESSQRHLKLRNEVPHQVPHFDPDLAENCGTHWLDSFQLFTTRSRSWDILMVTGISRRYPQGSPKTQIVRGTICALVTEATATSPKTQRTQTAKSDLVTEAQATSRVSLPHQAKPRLQRRPFAKRKVPKVTTSHRGGRAIAAPRAGRVGLDCQRAATSVAEVFLLWKRAAALAVARSTA